MYCTEGVGPSPGTLGKGRDNVGAGARCDVLMVNSFPTVSETQKPAKVTPQSLVTEGLLRATLKADKGDDAEMLSFEVKDFTEKGDNYSSVVTSGIVRYRQGDHKEKEVTYVAKCNPCRGHDLFSDFNKIEFMKEANFYSKLVPLINAELKAAGQEPLRVPACYVTHLVEGEEVILMKDLRTDGFKMLDRKKGMDVAHVTLVLRELARLHAASTLSQATMSQPIEVTYDFLQKDYHSISFPSGELLFSAMLCDNVNNSASMAEKIGGYDMVVDWLRSHASQAMNMSVECIKKSSPLNMVCHGDCWNNNVLFKYDETGKPVDVTLIDLQKCRKASPATDLNYLMYTSLNGPVRKENLHAFLKTYYDAFGQVLLGVGKTTPFTLEELKTEFHRLNLFGLLMGLMVAPGVVAEGAEMDFDYMTGDAEKDIQEFQKRMLDQVDTNPLVRPRLLATFDEMVEYGVIS